MATSTGIARSSRIFFSQPQLQSQPLLFFSKGFSAKVFVKGLSFSSTEKEIAEAFSEFGEVIEAKLVMDKARNRPKGYGFVTFAKKDAAEKACEGMNGKLLDGRLCEVLNLPARRRRSLSSKRDTFGLHACMPAFQLRD